VTNFKTPNAKRQTDTRGLLCVFAALFAGLLAGCRSQELPPTTVRKTTISVEALRPKPGDLALPKKLGSVRFAVIGDSGRGDQAQNEVAQQLVAWREKFDYDLVVMVGDNIYDRHTPEDYAAKFERPYKPLLDAGVKFQAAIGNHDDPAQINYEKFNMGGQRYYTFRRSDQPLGPITGGGVRFFALDSRSFDPEQLNWLQKELADTNSKWKIVYFHHPIYTSGRYQTAARTLRTVLEPLLVAGDVDVVISGHEHFYERILPQRGIVYFIAGAAGSLRPNDIRTTNLTARGFDTDYSFMLMEVSGSEMFFQAISRNGQTVDAGVIRKQ
jgi:predicted phosphodiesterase